jgi:hypothetical protein
MLIVIFVEADSVDTIGEKKDLSDIIVGERPTKNRQ